MSGIEVAGIVLAVLGTLIQGVGGYKEVITGRDVNLLVESLKDNKIMFSNSIEYLLRSVLPTEELTRLLNNPTGDQWKDDDLHERVIAHLGQDAETILQKIDDIYTTLERLQRKLPVSLHLLDLIRHKSLRTFRTGTERRCDRDIPCHAYHQMLRPRLIL
jgi:hypothetical protein